MSNRIDFEIANGPSADTLLVKTRDSFAALSVDEVSELIEVLASLRTSVSPEVSREPSPSRQYVVETSARWEFIHNPLFDGLVFFFRHSGAGWQGFAFPRESLTLLSEALTGA